MSVSVTLLSDRADFAGRWIDTLSDHGLESQRLSPDKVADAARLGTAVVVDVASPELRKNDDELLACFGFIRASGATAIAHVPTGLPNGIDDIIDELCCGLVVRNTADMARIAACLPRRLAAGRDARFEFVTISPAGDRILAIFASGEAVLEARPVATNDDGSAIAVIRLAGDARTATLELESGSTFEIEADALRPDHRAQPNGDTMLALEGGELGARLKALRLEAGLTQAELARRTGIHRPNIARVEAGRHTPSLETLSRIAHAIGVPTTQVLTTR